MTVDIRDLTISYRRRGRQLRVISDVSLVIQKGEAYGLVGESGCGKTTVALALMRYLPPNAVVESGQISFAGEDVLAASEATLRRWRGNRIAMVYQDPASALNPAIKVGRQIAEIYRYHNDFNEKDAFDAARAMLNKVQISDPGTILRRYPHQLSGGQQQRVMIAMALASSPELLVLDEPTTGLDATVEAEVLDLVADLRSELRMATLFISHNLGIVARLCDRVGVLYAGRLIEEGLAKELFAEPRHPYTLALLHCFPRRGVRKDTQRLEPIPGALPPLGARLQGCPYATRCAIAAGRCRRELPPLEAVTTDRASRCFFHASVPLIQIESRPAPVSTDKRKEEVLLSVDGLVKRYGIGGTAFKAVDGVSFEVRRGEVLGLVGESGSGKTTLAKCIVGLVDASEGTLCFDGVELGSKSRRHDGSIRRRLQMVFQNPDTALNPRHAVRRILDRAVKLLGGDGTRDGQQRRLGELAASVRLEPHHLDMRPRALSGGLKQRVAIARSFAGTPALVLCDEPVSALDVSVQAAILNLLVDLQTRKGVSYLFISHDLAVVRYIADRIGVMYLGQLVDIGPAEAVFEPPHHPYTEALLSAIPALDLGSGHARIKLHGPLPSPANPPSGCRFHTRCHRYLGDLCREREPPWQDDMSGNRYRCHIEPRELSSLQHG